MPDTSASGMRIRELLNQRDEILDCNMRLMQQLAEIEVQYNAERNKVWREYWLEIGEMTAELKNERSRDPKPNGKVKHG